MTNPQSEPKPKAFISFPCAFTFKAMLKKSCIAEAEKAVVFVVKQYAEVYVDGVSSQTSKNKNYVSVSCPAHLQTEQQLIDIYQALKNHPNIVMTL